MYDYLSDTYRPEGERDTACDGCGEMVPAADAYLGEPGSGCGEEDYGQTFCPRCWWG